jgi:hypothetical protein
VEATPRTLRASSKTLRKTLTDIKYEEWVAQRREVTPMGLRQLGLGRVVGNPTAAAVITTGSYQLINGGAIRTPGSLVITYDPTKPNNYGVNLENCGVPPDVWALGSGSTDPQFPLTAAERATPTRSCGRDRSARSSPSSSRRTAARGR